MKLLFDENLSYALVSLVEDIFSGSVHISSLIATGASDSEIWSIAKDNGFAVVSKDSHFRQRSFLYGAPPKVVCYRLEMLALQKSPVSCASGARTCLSSMPLLTLAC